MKNGIIKEYFDNGNIKSINNYLNDNLHGLCQTFFENGNLESSWLFKDDMRHGLCVTFYESGRVFKLSQYINDWPEGIYHEERI